MSSEAVARRLIERHRVDPNKYGQVARLVAFTHNLDAEFFDTDFLPNVLGLSRVDDKSYSAAVELERRLQGMSCRVAMAAPAYIGRPSLRTELLPLSLRAGRLHAKCCVVEYERGALVSLGSANLTSSGFRKNREVAGVMVTHEEARGDAATIVEAIGGALQCLSAVDHDWVPRVYADLESVRKKVLEWHPQLPSPPHRVLWSDGERRLIDTLAITWQGPPVRRIGIVSPFWSEDGAGPSPLRTLLERLDALGKLARDVEVHLYFDAHPLEEGGFRPAYPSGFQVDAPLAGSKLFAHAVDPSVDARDLDTKGELYATRPLHAKVFVFEAGTQALAYAGSANFTRRGLGIGQGANIEAGWLLQGSARQLRTLIPPDVGAPEVIERGRLIVESLREEEESAYFPEFLREVRLEHDPDQLGKLNLRVTWCDPAPERFELQTLTNAERRGVILLADGGRAGQAVLPLTIEALTDILTTREVWVRNLDQKREGSYPVNAADDARLLLPMAPGAERPGEEALLAYYRGQISFDELYPEPGREAELRQACADSLERSGVDTSSIQSYRIRAFVEALPGLLTDLERVCGPRPLLELRFLSDTSPVGLAHSIEAEVRAGTKSPTAAAFQLVEILRIVRTAASATGARDPDVLREVARQAEQRVATLLERVKRSGPELLDDSRAFRRFERAVLTGRTV